MDRGSLPLSVSLTCIDFFFNPVCKPYTIFWGIICNYGKPLVKIALEKLTKAQVRISCLVSPAGSWRASQKTWPECERRNCCRLRRSRGLICTLTALLRNSVTGQIRESHNPDFAVFKVMRAQETLRGCLLKSGSHGTQHMPGCSKPGPHLSPLTTPRHSQLPMPSQHILWTWSRSTRAVALHRSILMA